MPLHFPGIHNAGAASCLHAVHTHIVLLEARTTPDVEHLNVYVDLKQHLTYLGLKCVWRSHGY